MGVSKNHIHTLKENEYAAIAKVLAHPARIAILAFVAKSPGCLCKDIAFGLNYRSQLPLSTSR